MQYDILKYKVYLDGFLFIYDLNTKILITRENEREQTMFMSPFMLLILLR